MKKRLLMFIFVLCLSSFVLCDKVDAALTVKVGETKIIEGCKRSTKDRGNGSKISNTKIASLDMSSGEYKVTGKKVGSTTFTCDEKGAFAIGNWDLKINVVDAVTGSMTNGTLSLKVGEVKQLTCTEDGKGWFDDSGIDDTDVAEVQKIVGDQWYIKGKQQGSTKFTCDITGLSNNKVTINVTRDDGTSASDASTIRVGEKLWIACSRDTGDKQGWGTGNGTKLTDTYVASLEISNDHYIVTGKHEGTTVLQCDLSGKAKNRDFTITVVSADAEEADSSENGEPPGWNAPEEEDLPDVDTAGLFNPTETIGENFCSEPGVKKVLRFAGYFLYILRITVPLIIIASGSFLFFKAVVSDNDSDLKKSAIVFGKKVAGGILVFFVPTLFEAVFSLYSEFSDIESQYLACAHCLNNPSDCEIPTVNTSEDGSPTTSSSSKATKTAANCSVVGLSTCAEYSNCKVGQHGGTSPVCEAK